MTTVQDIYRFIDQVAPFAIQESWDNAGMLVGHWKRPVQKILVTLDITPEVVYEAEKVGADLIVAHHPILFHPAKQVTDGGMDLVGQRVLALAERGIAAICCHTNWDSAQGGVNYVLAKLCGLEKQTILEVSGTDEQGVPYGIGRIGTLPLPVALEDYLKLLKGSLEPNGLRYVDGGRPGGRRRRRLRRDAGAGGRGRLRHLRHRRREVRPVPRRQDAGHQPHRCRPLSHRGPVHAGAGLSAGKSLPGGDCAEVQAPR